MHRRIIAEHEKDLFLLEVGSASALQNIDQILFAELHDQKAFGSAQIIDSLRMEGDYILGVCGGTAI
jgi:hypothetical protein